MAGKEGRVQALIKNKFPKATLLHYSSHRLNLVVNDLNYVSCIKNSIGTIKSTINFFRESPQRNNTVPNVPILCETRWTQKYKSIYVFYKNFISIVAALTPFYEKQFPHQVNCIPNFVCHTNIYIHCLPCYLDLLKVKNHVKRLLEILKRDRENSDETFQNIFRRCEFTSHQA
ncbi:hypothetical protein PR048_012565 [Dryococelus australis]|uniref:Transposase n=1 Tax=Dryococelus australis TaxID=614101 RepID=A0ABQ9HPR6_9NEOP|nr:hypothetical protein PR048_012565 [Dryococelus australis]